MNKKEVSEIKKLLNKDNTRIDRIAGCYVDGEKQKKAVFEFPFLSIPDEQMHKYSEIFRKTLSGTLGKNLNTLEFDINEELEGSRHPLLMSVLSSELKEPEILEKFYDDIIEGYFYPENYLLLLAHGVYDVPSKTKDNMEQFDASEYVYDFIVCSICPVKLSKPGLCYDDETKSFIEHLRDWMLDAPSNGFLFPAFNDRNKDIHSILYYSKNADDLHPELTKEILGCEKPVPAKNQKEEFGTVVEEVFGKECSFDTIKEIHETLAQLIEDNKDEPEPLIMKKEDVKNLLEQTGADREKLAVVDERLENEEGPDEEFWVSNIASTRKFEVKTQDLTVSVSADRTDLLETRIIDGRECLIIPLTDDITVNGIGIHPKFEKTEE